MFRAAPPKSGWNVPRATACSLFLAVSCVSCGVASLDPVLSPHAPSAGLPTGAPTETNPADAQARRRDQNPSSIAGFTLDLVGMAGIATGAGMAMHDDAGARSTGSLVALGGAVTVVVGTFLMIYGASPSEIDSPAGPDGDADEPSPSAP